MDPKIPFMTRKGRELISPKIEESRHRLAHPIEAETLSGNRPGTDPGRSALERSDTSHKPRVLVVDDEPTLRSVISEVLTDDGYQVTDAASGEQALSLYRSEPFPIVMTDIIMGKMNGLELLNEIKVLDPEGLVIMMTSQASLDIATAALRSGAYDFLTKPFEDLDLISAVVNRAAEKFRLQEHNRSLMEHLKRNSEQLEVLNRNLRDMANRDGLTGIFNHRHFREALEIELGRSSRHGHSFSLIFIDVDHFKQYNDAHGHLAGDEVLKVVARILVDQNRASSICARYGGEEFVVLIPEVGRGPALVVAERMRQGVEAYPFEGRETQPLGKVTISLGVSGYPADGSDGKALIGQADKALYQAKQKGRNVICG